MHSFACTVYYCSRSPPLPLLFPLPQNNYYYYQTCFFPNPNKSSNSLTKDHISPPKSISDGELDSSTDTELLQPTSDDDDDVDIEITKLGKNERRIQCQIAIDANLQTVWNLLTDYNKLPDFIPGLAVCQLLERTDNRARLFQIGQQNLAFGLKFSAKGIVDCYEKDLERFPFGLRREIEFKMAEGDFQVFEGKWSIEETNNKSEEIISTSVEKEYQTTLSYVVDVKPKLWLPVRLVEGRLCREIKLNLLCIRAQAQKAVHDDLHTC